MYLKDGKGYVYPWTRALSERTDMREISDEEAAPLLEKQRRKPVAEQSEAPAEEAKPPRATAKR